MEHAELAAIARLNADNERSRKLLRKAFTLEKQAAKLTVSRINLEPTRSILHRSAATLALDCREFREAEQLASMALAGDPPPEILEELRELLDQIHFRRHLSVRGVELADQEVQLSLWGEEVGPGIARSEALIGRVNVFEKMIHRTAERILGKPYRNSPTVPRDIKDQFEMFLSVPRAASFAVSIRVGGAASQDSFGFHENASAVIDQILDCLEITNKGLAENLKASIPDEAYRRNFLQLTKQLAPRDRSKLSVGLTVIRNSQSRSLVLERTQSQIQAIVVTEPPDSKTIPVSVIGKLLHAEARPGKKERIDVIDDSEETHRVNVPTGMMSDIVKPLWAERVKIEGFRRPGPQTAIILTSIERVED